MKNKVSVIIPVFNVEKFLEKCLNSVCNQTLKEIEIICINDCSSDSSLNILKNFSSKDNRIRLVNFDKNKGVAIARNTAITLATGEYIGFVDADDWIDLNFYEKLYSKAKNKDADLAIGNIHIVNEQGNYINSFVFDNIRKSCFEQKLNFTQLFWLGLYKKNLIQNHDVNFF